LVLLATGVRFGVSTGVALVFWFSAEPLRLEGAEGAFWMARAVITKGTAAPVAPGTGVPALDRVPASSTTAALLLLVVGVGAGEMIDAAVIVEVVEVVATSGTGESVDRTWEEAAPAFSAVSSLFTVALCSSVGVPQL